MTTSDARTILAELRAAGVEVVVDGDELVLKSIGRLTPDLVGRLKANKPAVLALLRGDHWGDRSDCAGFATSDVDLAQGKPLYSPDDPMLAEPDTANEAAMDLVVLTYACARRARMLAELGDKCPSQAATSIRQCLDTVHQALGDDRHPQHHQTRGARK